MSADTITRISHILCISTAMVRFLYDADSGLLSRLSDEENQLAHDVHHLVRLDEEV